MFQAVIDVISMLTNVGEFKSRSCSRTGSTNSSWRKAPVTKAKKRLDGVSD